MLVVAHRTLPPYAPENSIRGIRTTNESGADAVEFDVRRTVDGVAVLMHDRTAWRTTRGAWLVRVLPVRVIPSKWVRRLRLRDDGSPVPTLAEALAALPLDVLVAIDVKHASATRAVLAAVHAQRLESRAMVWSERSHAVRTAARDAPAVEVALLRDARAPAAVQRFLDDAVRLGARAISAHWDTVTPEFLDRAHARGLTVYSWCEELARLPEKRGMALDGVVTEWPAETRAVLDRATED